MRVTISIGVAQYEGNRKRFFQAADRALYRAKAEGKNCVVIGRGSEACASAPLTGLATRPGARCGLA